MMANGIEREKPAGSECSEMFTEEEVSEISGLNIGEDYIEVMCGCTSHRYGDAVGKLRVFPSGHLEINCECTPGCDEGKLLSCLYACCPPDPSTYILISFVSCTFHTMIHDSIFGSNDPNIVLEKYSLGLWLYIYLFQLPSSHIHKFIHSFMHDGNESNNDR